MLAQVTKKVRFLKEINTLYSYMMHRGYVKVRTALKMPPLYPYENEYILDAPTQQIVEQMQKAIPDQQRGDNPRFNKHWKSIMEREEVARKNSAIIKSIIPDLHPNTHPEWLASIVESGYSRLVQKNLTTQKVDEILHYLQQQKVYAAHVAHFALEKPKPAEAVKKTSAFGSYDLETIVCAPYVAELLTDRDVLGMISAYFGCLPTISSVNLFWAFASPDGKSRGPQRFHRDVDDFKTCTMFINMTDTKEDEGAHCYIERSHTLERLKAIFDDSKNDALAQDLNPFNRRIQPEDLFQLPLNGYSFDKLYRHFFQSRMVNLFGPRGMVLITDNYGIHRGVPSKNSDRLILWVSFSLTATHTQSAEVKPQKRVSYAKLKGRIPDNKINRYVLRDVVNFS